MDGVFYQPHYRLDFVRDAEPVTMVRQAGDAVRRSSADIHLHDLRDMRVNRQFAEEIDISRRKLNDPRGAEVGFHDEAICLIRKAHFEMKLAWTGDTFLNISGGAGNLARTIADPASPGHEKWKQTRGDIPRISGKSVVFTGAGIASNYYHWIGEQMPRLSLLRRSGHLAKMDNIVVFVGAPAPYIEETVRTLYPEFTGQVIQLCSRMALVDYALFFVPHSLAARSARAPREVADLRTSWGSLLWAGADYDARAGDIVPADGGCGPVVVVSRAGTGRVWQNEAAMVERLAPLGVVAIRTEDLSIPEQIAAMHHARVVIAKHGAGLANILFCRPGTTVIELTGRSYARRSWDFAKIAIARGLVYHAVIADLPADDPFQTIAEPQRPVPHPVDAHLRTGDEANAFIERTVREALTGPEAP